MDTGVEYPGTRSSDIGSFDCDYVGNTFSILHGNEGRCGQQVSGFTAHFTVDIGNLSLVMQFVSFLIICINI